VRKDEGEPTTLGARLAARERRCLGVEGGIVRVEPEKSWLIGVGEGSQTFGRLGERDGRVGVVGASIVGVDDGDGLARGEGRGARWEEDLKDLGEEGKYSLGTEREGEGGRGTRKGRGGSCIKRTDKSLSEAQSKS
jgi:hypothetical protein